MGEEIKAVGFTSEDKARFAERLARETGVARDLFAAGKFSRGGHMLGFEIEAWILDHNYFPAPINVAILDALRHPLATPELSRFNLELNCDPLPLEGDALGRAHDALAQVWAHCNDEAHRLDANLVLIGTLPTIRDEDLTLDNMSPLNRYYALNAEVLRIISQNREWMKKYAIAKNIVQNPRTPIAIALNHLKRMHEFDLKLMAIDRNLAEVLRREAKRMFEGKSH